MISPLLGRKQTPEHIQKRVESFKQSAFYQTMGQWSTEQNKARKGTKLSEEHKQKIAKAMKGKRNSLGRVQPLEFRQHLSKLWKDNPNHNHWVDGKGAERHSAREKDMSRLEYRLWREAVFQRDNWTCVRCQQVGGTLQADHIKLYSTHPDLRYEPTNGRTLCKPCHVSRNKWDNEVPA